MVGERSGGEAAEKELVLVPWETWRGQSGLQEIGWKWVKSREKTQGRAELQSDPSGAGGEVIMSLGITQQQPLGSLLERALSGTKEFILGM